MVVYITQQNELCKLVSYLSLCSENCIGLDVETSGLSPFKDHIRLLTLSTECYTFVCDTYFVDIRPLFSVLYDKILLTHNGQFDFAFLWRLGFVPGQVRDTMLMSQILYAGMKDEEGKRLSHSLEAVTQREFGTSLVKELQKSDWTGELTQEQVDYAVRDTEILFPIYERLRFKLSLFNLDLVTEIEHRCLPTVVWMYMNGVPLNVKEWKLLAEEAGMRIQLLEEELDDLVLEELGYPIGIEWSSPHQIKDLFNNGLGIRMSSTREEWLVACEHPIAKLLLEHRENQKLATTYGQNYLDLLESDGRLHPQYLQNTTATGRFAAIAPNVQQIPKDVRYRNCIEAPAGCKLVICDYDQIELRLAAKISGDQTMLEVYRNGGDLHTTTAKQVLKQEVVSKDARQIAKSANFGALYGAGPARLQVYMATKFKQILTIEEVTDIRNSFFNTYSGLKAWHRTAGNEPKSTRTLANRWRCNVEKFSEQLNSPVQGSGADGLKVALALLWERRNESYGYHPILTAHDEIVIEGPQEYTEKGKEWLEKCMNDGMKWLLDPVPTSATATIANRWGEK